MQILIHPGFHKTGTTSLQYALKHQAEVLAPRLRVLETADFPKTVLAARRYSTDPAPRRLEPYGKGMAEALSAIDTSDPRPLLISSEKLIGRIPGRVDNWSYDTTPALLDRLTDVFKAHFGEGLDLTIWFTTRNPKDWQRSVYWQNLRALRITEDFETYRPRLNRAAKHDEVVEATRRRLEGRARVLSSPIEKIGRAPLGPLGVALDLLGVSTEGLEPVRAFNVQPIGAAEELLALNRSSLDDDELKAARHELFQSYRRKGKTRRAPTDAG